MKIIKYFLASIIHYVLFFTTLFSINTYSHNSRVLLIENIDSSKIRSRSKVVCYPFNLLSNTINLDSKSFEKRQSISQIITSCAELRNIKLARNPRQILITNDNKYAFVSCFLGNKVEMVDLKNATIVKSFSIPSPSFMTFSNDAKKLYISSFVSDMSDSLRADDCGINIYFSNDSKLSVINIEKQVLERTQLITDFSGIHKILLSNNPNIIYLIGSYRIAQLNLDLMKITKFIGNGKQLFSVEIDNKNNRIFMTQNDTLQVYDINNNRIHNIPYKDVLWGSLAIDTLTNRLFTSSRSEITIYNTVTLDVIKKITKQDYIIFTGALFCPDRNRIFIWESAYNPIIEIDYTTLEVIKFLIDGFSLHLDPTGTKLFMLRNGPITGILWSTRGIYCDISMYDLTTGKTIEYRTTDSTYNCMYSRTLVVTSDFKRLIATNSPENTISILTLANDTTTSIKGQHNSSITISDYSLSQNYPNPFNPTTTIKFSVPSVETFHGTSLQHVALKVYDLLGREVSTLVNEEKAPGIYEVKFDGINLPSGVYFYRLQAGSYSQTKKLILMK